MKKLLSLLGLVLLTTGLATAQLRYEINPYGGYRIGGDFKFTVFDTDITHEIDFESGPEFGLNASVGLSPGFYVELQCSRAAAIGARHTRQRGRRRAARSDDTHSTRGGGRQARRSGRGRRTACG